TALRGRIVRAERDRESGGDRDDRRRTECAHRGPSCAAHVASSFFASSTPAPGWPYSLAVTLASATRCRQRKAGRVVANSSVAVRKYFSACNAPSESTA